MTYPLVAELAEAGVPVTVSCRVLKLARQPYYRWRNDPIRDADVLRAYRINALHDAHEATRRSVTDTSLTKHAAQGGG